MAQRPIHSSRACGCAGKNSESPGKMPASCAVHGVPLVTFCPSCRGALGGAVSSPAKTAANRANAAKPRPRARNGKEQA